MWPKLLLPVAVAMATLISDPANDARIINAQYPEGPLWRDERLFFADMRADRVVEVAPEGERSFFKQEGCGPTAIASYGDGFLVLCHLGARIVAVDDRGREIRHWVRGDNGIHLSNPNDASYDGQGGVYFSDPGRFASSTLPHGRIMHLSATGVLREVARDLWYPNGVHVSEGALYVSEHLGRRILRYNIEDDGRLGNMHVFADLEVHLESTRWDSPYALAGPDGLEFGPDGALYVALYGEGDILKFSQQGELLGRITTDIRYLTNIAFGDENVALTGIFDNRAQPNRGQTRIGQSIESVGFAP